MGQNSDMRPYWQKGIVILVLVRVVCLCDFHLNDKHKAGDRENDKYFSDKHEGDVCLAYRNLTHWANGFEKQRIDKVSISTDNKHHRLNLGTDYFQLTNDILRLDSISNDISDVKHKLNNKKRLQEEFKETIYTWYGFCHLYKGDNFYDFLFAFIYTNPLMKRGLL